MSSITRKNKRRVAFKCAKQGIAPAQAIAVSAAREIKATKEATAETMEVLLQAIALVAAHDYGKLNAKDTRKHVSIGDEKMKELKLSSPLNVQIITEPERMALRIALDKSIGENLGMVLALKDTKREMPQGLYNSGLDYHRDNLEIYLRLRNRLEDAIYEAESNGKQGDKKA